MTVAEQPPPSAKALGKRKQQDPALSSSSINPPNPNKKQRQQPQLKAVQKQERRVTRSSLGGDKARSDDANDVDGDGTAPNLYLPLKTPILLTTQQLPHLRRVPPPKEAQPVILNAPSTSEAGPSTTTPLPVTPVVPNDVPQQAVEPQRPLFRKLEDGELLPPRGSRHAAAPEVDDSDAFYLRLHRYPEVLERRASRLERERLIHERSKLILELEELRGRTWVYAGTTAGGRAEEERQRKIRDMEEKLARYDALLPNQPRKSNFLNLGGAAPAATPPIASTSHNRERQHDRDNRPSPSPSPSSTYSSSSASSGPALPAPSRPRVGGRSTRAHPVLAASTSAPSLPHPSSSTAPAPNALEALGASIPRPSTPLSATHSGSGGTTIRIRFGPPSAASSPAPPAPLYPHHARPPPPASKTSAPPSRLRSRRPSDISNQQPQPSSSATASPQRRRTDYGLTQDGEPRRGPKRDRRAERQRAEERRKLGLAPRANIEKFVGVAPGGAKTVTIAESPGGSGAMGAAMGRREGEPQPKRRDVGRRRASQAATYAGMDNDDSEEEEDEEDELGEDAESDLTEDEDDQDEDDHDGGQHIDPETGAAVPRASSSRRRRPSASATTSRRLHDSFFASAALRDSFWATPEMTGRAARVIAKLASYEPSSSAPAAPTATPAPSAARPARRASSRVSVLYAFGHPLPTAALGQQFSFEPHGGISDGESENEGESEIKLEDMVRLRMEEKGERAVVVGGRVLPQSAMDAWAQGPIAFSPSSPVKMEGGGSTAPSAQSESLGGAFSVAMSSRAPSPALSPAEHPLPHRQQYQHHLTTYQPQHLHQPQPQQLYHPSAASSSFISSSFAAPSVPSAAPSPTVALLNSRQHPSPSPSSSPEPRLPPAFEHQIAPPMSLSMPGSFRMDVG